MTTIKMLPIDETLSVGIDVGIGSAGCAGISEHSIIGTFVRCFGVPEEPDTRKLLNANRWEHRLMRRQIRRRRQRRNAVARILSAALDLTPEQIKARDAVDPWAARADGLDIALSPMAFAAAIMHIAKRRGFRSNSKSGPAGNEAEGGKLIKALNRHDERAQPFVTVGKMFAEHPDYAHKKRNREGDYSHTIRRADAEREIRKLFQAQRRLGQAWATQEAEDRVVEDAMFQRPLQSSEGLVGFARLRRGRSAPALMHLGLSGSAIWPRSTPLVWTMVRFLGA